MPELRAAWTRIRHGESLLTILARPATAFELGRVHSELNEGRARLVHKHLGAAARRKDPTEQIEAILRSGALSVKRTGFDNGYYMRPLRDSLGRLVQEGRRIPLALLLGGGKAPNPLKTDHGILPDVGEWLAMQALAALAEAIGTVHHAGAVVLAIPDAGLHSADLGFAYHETWTHVRRLRKDLALLGISDLVVVPDTVEHLPEAWASNVYENARVVERRVVADAEFAAEVSAQAESLMFSQNTRLPGWSFEHAVEVFSAAAGDASGTSLEAQYEAAVLYQRTRQTAPLYVATNQLIRRMSLVQRVVEDYVGSPEHVRLSVHAKPGEPRPALLEPNRHARMALLPMHGRALRFSADGQAKYGIVFELEARVRGYRPVVSVEDGRFLYYEPVPQSGAADASAPTLRAA